MSQILSDTDIKKIWKNVRSVTSEEAACATIGWENLPRPIKVGNGYLVLLTINIYRNGYKQYHLSISDSSGIVNFEIAVAIARIILGNCEKLDVGFRGVYHFVKDAREIHSQQIIKNKEVDKNKNEEELNDGISVEGDVKNGIERRIKKEIQTKDIAERSHWVGKNFHVGQNCRVCSIERLEGIISRS